MEKKEALTIEERNELMTFVGECVIENKAFPNMKMGAQNLTIQELLHERSDADIRNLGIAVNQAKSKFDPDFSSSNTYKIGGVDGDKFVKILKLILKHRAYADYKLKLASKKADITKQLASLKTPDELKKELMAELDAMEA